MGEMLLQVIGPDGAVDPALDPGLPEEDLRRLYRAMVRTRALEERGNTLQRQGRIGFYIGCAGQEAAHIGSALALRPEDWVFPSYREPGIALLRGVPMALLVHHLFADSRDLAKGRQMPCHYAFPAARFVSISSPIGTQIPQAVGAAMAAKMRRDPVVAVTYFGDGATSSNDFHVGMNFAGVYRAPVILVCENNQWAISLPVAKQTASETIAIKAQAYGFEGVRVDGNDALAVYRAAREAAEKAREGGGPTLIEAVTYRMGPHSTSDDPRRYRPETEVEDWRRKDPILRLRIHLEHRGIWDEGQETKAWEEARAEVQEAIREAEATPPPGLETLTEDVFARETWSLIEQREALLREGPREGRR